MKAKSFDNIGETLYSGVLENGLSVHVMPKAGFNKSYAFFATNYGGADRRFKLSGKWIDTPAGVAHFLEHKMFDTPDGGNALNVLSANGASPNAYTSSGITAYFFESTEGFYENLETLLKFVSVPYFTDESVEKEQGIIGQEIRMVEDMPFHVVYYNLLKCLFTKNPVRDSVAGTVESISEITSQTLYDCHKVFYNPSNMVLCVVGDVDPERVLSMARDVLPKEAGEQPERDYGRPEGVLPNCTLSEVYMEVAAPLFLIGAKMDAEMQGTERLRQMLTADIALNCLCGTSSDFYTTLYKEGLLNNMFGYETDYTASVAMTFFEGESRDPKAVFEKLKQAIDQVSKFGLDEDMFKRQKKASFGARLRGLGAFEHQCRMLAEGQFAGFNHLEAFDILNDITKAQAEEFIRTNLASERLALSIVYPKK